MPGAAVGFDPSGLVGEEVGFRDREGGLEDELRHDGDVRAWELGLREWMGR